MTKKRSALFIATALFLGYSNIAKAETKPLKVVAPDLVVESFEFGKYTEGKGPIDDHSGKSNYEFIPVPSNVAKETGCGYGYRIRLKTHRTKIRIGQSVDKPFPHEPKKGEGRQTTPVDGCIYDEWLLDGFKNGSYSVRVWVEDVELPKLNYKVAY
jgi:hypothetical protein